MESCRSDMIDETSCFLDRPPKFQEIYKSRKKYLLNAQKISLFVKAFRTAYVQTKAKKAAWLGQLKRPQNDDEKQARARPELRSYCKFHDIQKNKMWLSVNFRTLLGPIQDLFRTLGLFKVALGPSFLIHQNSFRTLSRSFRSPLGTF